jgi:DNA-binding transcriptional MocR family regulator
LALNLQIDKQDKGGPLYRQIAELIIHRIEEGALPNGSKLPTVRELADELDVTRVTAHNAYNELKSRGWIDATVGRGTYVTGPRSEPPERIETLSGSAITPDKIMADIARMMHLPGTRSLAMAEPDSRLYPATEFLRLLRPMENQAEELFRYGPYQGEADLRHMLSGLLRERGIRTNPDDIIVTTGVTQGLALATAALCEPGDRVLVERPTYLGFLSLLESMDVEPIGIPLDDQGPDLNYLKRVLVRERPRFLYTIPTFQNPTGLSMSEHRRGQLLALAGEYGLSIVEDDIYGRLSYDGPPPRPLKARDRDNLVVYLDSFSKSLLPGLRVGFVVPPTSLKEKLLSLLRARELGGSPLIQRCLAEFIRRGMLQEHWKRAIPAYRRRRDLLVEALRRSMPEGVEWTHPRGGFCSWVSLPEEGDFSQLYRAAVSRGVAYTPGEVFLTAPDRRRHLRLCFSSEDDTVIREAVSILGELVKNESRQASIHGHLQGSKPIV